MQVFFVGAAGSGVRDPDKAPRANVARVGCGTLWRMPWTSELFSAPMVERVQEKWTRELETVPLFDGLLAGEFDALVGSFAGEPELHLIAHGPDRNLSVDEIGGIQLAEEVAAAEA